MRAVQHDEPVDGLRAGLGRCPGDGTAPVMTDDVRTVLAERLDEPDDVGDENRDPVIGHAWRLVALRVAAEVGCNNTETLGECGDLLAPGIGTLWKPVEQENERALPFEDAVKADAVDRNVPPHRHMLARAMP